MFWTRFIQFLRWGVFLVVLVVYGGLLAAQAEERAYAETGVVVTGSYSWKPYSFMDASGNPAGFFVDYWTHWSHKTGVPVEFRLVSWNKSLELVADNKADIQCGMFITEERGRLFDFSSAVFETRSVSVVRKEVQCSDNLSTVRWGGIKGTAELAMIRDMYPDMDVTVFKDSNQLMAAMGTGDVDASINDWATVTLLSREMGLEKELTICSTVSQRDLHAAVPKGRPELLKLVNDGIVEMNQEKKRLMINRWFVGHESDASWRDVVTPVVIALLVSLGVWLWTFQRRR